ncbi:MAG: histidinol phosphatase [Puia sp.]|nr:histidinol phosphatase [Puia sp.]
MFTLFRKKTQPLSDFSALRCDMHSHLIPGVDDGSPDMDTSIRLIRGLVGLGYKKIITTPHVLSDMFPNNRVSILGGLEKVKAAIVEQKIDVEFSAAAEYMMDGEFSKMIDANEPLLTLNGNLVLVELSLVVPSINLKDMLFRLQIKGYQPVLAHPERYLYFAANKDWYEQMKDIGCWFQLNLLSLAKHYGKGGYELAQFLIKKKYINLVGTDLHHEGHLHILQNSTGIRRELGILLDSGLIQNATSL